MRCAIVENDTIINVIEAEPGFLGCVPCPEGAEVGYTLTNGVWTAPVVVTPIPSAVTMRQARLALLAAGHLAAVEAAIAAMPGVEGDAARIEWEYAATVERSSALVSGMASALSLTDTQLDDLFRAAEGL